MKVLLVGGRSDHFLQSLASELTRRGHASIILSMAEFSRMATVSVEQGQARVTPEWPIFHRPGYEAGDADADSVFLLGEQISHAWAAIALTSATVVNRPRHHGTATPSHGLSAMMEYHQRAPDDALPGLPETLASDLTAPSVPGDDVQELFTGKILAPGAVGCGPVRVRRAGTDIPADAVAYAEFLVVGHEAWPVRVKALRGTECSAHGRAADIHGDIPLDAIAGSAACVGLDVASVTVLLCDRGRARLARISGYPSLTGIDPSVTRRALGAVACMLTD